MFSVVPEPYSTRDYRRFAFVAVLRRFEWAIALPCHALPTLDDPVILKEHCRMLSFLVMAGVCPAWQAAADNPSEER